MEKTRNTNNKRKHKKMAKSQKGITLVALVITIIIIIILATVAINFAFGNNGLITRAEQARDFYANDTKYTEESMSNVESYLEGMLPGGSGTEEETTPPTITNISTSNVTTNSITVTVTATAGTSEITSYTYSITGQEPVTVLDASYTFTGLTANTTYDIQVTVTDKAGKTATQSAQATTKQTTVADAIENSTSYTNTTEIADDLGNPVWIPGGFHLATDSGTKVEEGIVIEDNTANKNQFVWIPVGTYNVTNEVDSDETKDGKMTNALSRRTFTSTGSTPVSGDNVTSGVHGDYYYGEENTNSVAKNQIESFKTSATSHGGFYIGRYEQGSGNVIKAGVAPYTNVTRDTAKSRSEAMYSGNSNIKATTELISSYAWDTALNFICQTNTAGYTLATTTSSSYGNINTESRKNTGVDANDNYSKIHDLLGNCWEWTTEYSSYSDSRNTYPCVGRGGTCSDSNFHAANRSSSIMTLSGNFVSFRAQLYVK